MQAHYLQGETWAAVRSKVDWQSKIIDTPDGAVRIYTRGGPLVGKIGYAPMCPPLLTQNLLRSIDSISSEFSHLSFIRLEPEQDIETIHQESLKSSGLIKPSKKKIQYQSTVEINLNPNEEELLNSFSKNTRYNIRKAEKRGVSIVAVEPDIDQLEQLYKFKTITSERSDHYLRPKAFLIDFWGQLAENHNAVLLRAEHEGEVISIGLSAIEGDRAWNIATGSLRTKRSLAAPALMHWEMMKQLKARNVNRYDMTGISPPEIRADMDNPMSGVDSFKTGFGEQYIRDYPGVYDLVLNKRKYNLWSRIESQYVRVQTKLSGNYWW